MTGRRPVTEATERAAALGMSRQALALAIEKAAAALPLPLRRVGRSP